MHCFIYHFESFIISVLLDILNIDLAVGGSSRRIQLIRRGWNGNRCRCQKVYLAPAIRPGGGVRKYRQRVMAVEGEDTERAEGGRKMMDQVVRWGKEIPTTGCGRGTRGHGKG